MNEKQFKEHMKEMRAQTRLLEVLVKRSAPDAPDAASQIREALSEKKPTRLYDGAEAFLNR